MEDTTAQFRFTDTTIPQSEKTPSSNIPLLCNEGKSAEHVSVLSPGHCPPLLLDGDEERGWAVPDRGAFFRLLELGLRDQAVGPVRHNRSLQRESRHQEAYLQVGPFAFPRFISACAGWTISCQQSRGDIKGRFRECGGTSGLFLPRRILGRQLSIVSPFCQFQ
jgi:hypothetical protein